MKLVRDWLWQLGAIIIALISVFYFGANWGKNQEKDKDLRNMKKAHEVENENNAKSPDDVKSDLDKWMRD